MRNAITAGMTIARISPGREITVKPTTNLLQSFGSQATKNLVTLDRERTIDFASGLDIRLSQDEPCDAEDGYVIVKFGETVLGCGLKQGVFIRCLVPKAKRIRLKFL